MFVLDEKIITDIEKKLFNKSTSLSNEQKDFIVSNKRDVIASAGTGKTTALTAKIMYFFKAGFFNQNRGVCVISHTNVAVNQINDSVRKGHFKLNSLSFVGTSQSFLITFIFSPVFNSIYKNSIKHYVDNDLFSSKISQTMFAYCNKDQTLKKAWAKIYYRDKINIYSHLSLDLTNKIEVSDFLSAKLKAIDGLYEKFVQVVNQKIFDQGFITHDIVTNYSKTVFDKYPSYFSNILKNRFSHVFIDEFQDTDQNHVDIYDKLFSNLYYQKIGDPNQKLYDTASEWKPNDYFELKETRRFGNNLCKLSKRFAVQDIDPFSTQDNIKILCYILNDKTSYKRIKTQFINDCNKYDCRLSKSVITGITYKQPKNGMCLSLIDCSDATLNDNIKLFNSFFLDGSLNKYDNICKFFVYVLREEYCKLNNKFVSIPVFKEWISEKYKIKTIFVKLNKLMLSGISDNNIITIKNELKRIVALLLKKMEKDVQRADNYVAFLDSDNLQQQVSVRTIKAIKGETHDATAVVETFYKQHDFEQALKMMKKHQVSKNHNCELYVGMTRPQKLLVLCVRKETYSSNVEFFTEICTEGNIINL